MGTKKFACGLFWVFCCSSLCTPSWPTRFQMILLPHFLYPDWSTMVAEYTTMLGFMWVLEGSIQVLMCFFFLEVLYPLDHLSFPLPIFPMGYTINLSITILDHWTYSHEWQSLTIYFRILLQTKVSLLPKGTCFMNSVNITKMMFFLKIFL